MVKNLAAWDSIDVAEPLESAEISPRKARMLYHNGLWRQMRNYLGVCLFVSWSQKQLCEAVEAVCGWPMSHWRLMKTVERGATLARIFNLREGFSRGDDMLPERFFSPPSDGPLKDSAIDRKAFNAAREIYYQMMGWDPEGVPTYARLVELGIEWAEQYIDRRG